MINYFDKHKKQRQLILNIIYANKEYLLTNIELKSLIDLYLLVFIHLIN